MHNIYIGDMQILAIIVFFISISALIVWFFIKNDRGTKEPISELWKAVIIGFLGFIGAGLIESWIIPESHLSPKTSSISISFFTYVLVGVIEESLKFLPLAIYIYKKKYFNEHTDGVIYFAIVGIGFGVPENIAYSIISGAPAGMTRLILLPIFHAATAAIVGYYLIKVKLDKKPWWTVGLALLIVIMIHGLFDFCLSTQNPSLIMASGLITFTVSFMLFVLFFKASKLDKKAGLYRSKK